MDLLNVAVILVVIGVILGFVNNYILMDAKIKSILNLGVVIITCVWLLQTFGIIGHFSIIHF